MKQLFLFAALTLIIGTLSISKAVAADLVAPQIPIEKASSQIKEKLKNKDFAKDFIKVNDYVAEVIAPHTDFDKISRLVVGKHWKTASAEEKNNFKQEFKKLLVRTYSRAFFDFDQWTIRFLPLNMESAVKKVKNTEAVIVKTEILQPGKPPFSLNYRMWKVDGDWKVYDMMIEGISLVKNYRKSIGTRIKKSGSTLATVTEFLAKKNSDALARESGGKNNS
jgi:phospholipid transport system substrate-binding protein